MERQRDYLESDHNGILQGLLSMAITTAVCNSFKTEVLGGIHDLDTDTIKIALIKDSESGTYDKTITNYSDLTGNTDEASGVNYTAGGNTLSGASISLDGDTAIVDFSDTAWLSATISASGAIIYNSSKSNRAIAVLSFGGTVTSTAGDFTIQFPAAAASTAIITLV
jgi:hypothetical protein